MKEIKEPSIDRIYKTKAYDKLESFCDDDKGGDSCFMMADKYDRQQVVNLLVPIIRNEIRATADNNDFKKPCPNCNGTGRMIENHTLRDVKFDCLTCNGQGFIKS